MLFIFAVLLSLFLSSCSSPDFASDKKFFIKGIYSGDSRMLYFDPWAGPVAISSSAFTPVKEFSECYKKGHFIFPAYMPKSATILSSDFSAVKPLAGRIADSFSYSANCSLNISSLVRDFVAVGGGYFSGSLSFICLLPPNGGGQCIFADYYANCSSGPSGCKPLIRGFFVSRGRCWKILINNSEWADIAGMVGNYTNSQSEASTV